MKHMAQTRSGSFHPYTFEKAREALITIQTLTPTLTPAELETLMLLLDDGAMKTIESSVGQARAGMFESLEEAVGKS